MFPRALVASFSVLQVPRLLFQLYQKKHSLPNAAIAVYRYDIFRKTSFTGFSSVAVVVPRTRVSSAAPAGFLGDARMPDGLFATILGTSSARRLWNREIVRCNGSKPP